jgi:VIT1/CCC1 family predicted Fe2+/Mn2+ transporter
MPHREFHRTAHIGWLRAAVLGANDGLISTSGLVVGVAAAQPTKAPVALAALAGMVAGALSMAAGEYVSVSSQADTEEADLARERRELAADPASEHEELAGIYRARGLSPALADQVARELAARDVLAAHARDDLGMTEASQARPLQAAGASAAASAAGTTPPVLLVLLLPLASITFLWPAAPSCCSCCSVPSRPDRVERPSSGARSASGSGALSPWASRRWSAGSGMTSL